MISVCTWPQKRHHTVNGPPPSAAPTWRPSRSAWPSPPSTAPGCGGRNRGPPRADGWPSSARGPTGSAVTCCRCRGTPGRGSTSTAASRTCRCLAGSSSRTSAISGCTVARLPAPGTAHRGAGRTGRRPVRRVRAFPGRRGGLVRAGTAAGLPRGGQPDQPRDRGRPAGRLGRGRPRRDPGPGQRFGLLRLPDAVTGRHPAGLDLLGSPPDAMGRHRTPVAALGGTGPVSDQSQQQLIMGGDAESVLAPVWRDNRSLYAISDRSGWWNLYVADVLARPQARPASPGRCARERRSSPPRCGSWA